MIKRLIIIIISLLLFGCQSESTEIKEEIVIEEKNKYISPVKDVVLFDEIVSPKTKTRIKVANGNKDFRNEQFKMLNKHSYDGELVDINGNSINLIDFNTYVLEVVSVECSHCKKLITDNIEKMSNSTYPLIQYFSVGNKQEIYDFYDELDLDIPKNIIVIESNDDMKDYLKNYIKIESYPTLLSYINNNVVFDAYGEIKGIEMDEYYDISFVNTLSKDDLLNAKGEDILTMDWSIADIEDSMSKENIEKLENIDNDDYTKELTLKLIGSKVNFNGITNSKSSLYINEIDDYSFYKDKDLIIFYTFLKKPEDQERVKQINEFIALHNNYEYIVVLVEGFDMSSKMYSTYNIKFNCKTVSNLGYMPDDFYRVGISNYPTAIFVERGTFTGGYSNIDSIENYEKALDMFFGENCIALLSNN